MFTKVLKSVVKLAADIIKPVDPQFSTMHPRLGNRMFFPYFNNCIGAIDGIHVPCVVPKNLFMQHLSRAPYRQPQMTGLEWVQRNLGDRKSCYSMFRMSPDMFHSLHSLLVQSYGLKSSTKSTSIEALGMFLWMLGAPQSCRQAED